MADNFTVNQINGVLGEFKPSLDDAVSGGDFSVNNVNGVLGQFKPTLDEAAGAAAPAAPSIVGWKTLLGVGQG